MKGDFSRNSFRPAKHYSGVRQQQGRVQLDADWNEQVDIRTHLARTHRRDTIGLAAVPHSDGNFRISIGDYPDDFIIDPGRIYVNGILCELEEFPIPINEFDPDDNKVIQVAATKDEPSLQAGEQVQLTAGDVTTAVECRIDSVDDENRVTLDQDVSALSNESNPTLRRRTTYRHQPDYQVPSDGIAAGNTYLAYLDVWERHVTAIEDPTIREVALEGPDTATRTKTVWQVKLVNLEDSTELESLGLSELDKWDANARPDRGMLTARCQAPQSTDQVYSLTSGGGYQGPENQLYRVEIHAGGNLGNGSVNGPTFKWSRDNGSVVTRWLAQDKDLLTVESTGLDENFKFAKKEWIELTDDTLDLQGRRGVCFQIKEVADQTIIIDLDTKDDPDGVIPDGVMPDGDKWEDTAWYDCFGPHRKIRRWDFTALADMGIPAVDGATGDGWLTLENGIEVKFEPGSYRTGDYWLIPARRSKANIIWPADENDNPLPQPPAGIEHHYAPLAKLDYENSSATGEYPVIRDYRRVLRPLTDPQLEYLSGDGQEAKPGDQLPQPLRVGVFIGRQPVEGTKVRFTIMPFESGAVEGTLKAMPEYQSLPASGVELDVETNDRGEAACLWELPSYYGGTPDEQEERRTGQRVKVTLVDEAGRPLDDLPVYFTATLSLAEQVAYDSPASDVLADTTTVQDALDTLNDEKVNRHLGDTIEGPVNVDGNLDVRKTVVEEGAPETGKLTVEGNCVIEGNLDVKGARTEISTTQLIMEDNIIQVNKYDNQDEPKEIDAGLEVFRGGHSEYPNAQLIWDEVNDCWKISTYDPDQDQMTLVEIATIDLLTKGVSKVVEQSQHGFEVGQVLYFNGTKYQLACSDHENTTGMFMVSQIGKDGRGNPSGTHFTVVQAGYVDGLADLEDAADGASLKPGHYYFVSDQVAGALTPVEPLHISNPIFFADTAESGFVLPFRPGESIQHVLHTLRVLEADPEAPDGALFVDGDGQLGIGTDQPNAKLEIAGGGLTVGNEGDNSVIKFQAANERTGMIGVQDDGIQGFFVHLSGEYRMSVNQNGNVGIGTTTARAKLDVAGDLKLNIGEGLHFLSDYAYWGTNHDARVIRMIDTNGFNGIVDGGIAIEGYTPKDEIRKPVMAIRGSGSVGIGTQYPKSMLHVKARGAGWQDHLVLEGSDADSEWNLLVDSGLSGASDNALRFKYHTGTEALTLLTNGNVGIGTATPEAKLDLVGDLRVEGRITIGEQDFSQVFAGSHGSIVNVPSGTRDDWNIFVAPREMGHEERTSEGDNALIRIECWASSLSTTQWVIRARYKYRYSRGDGVWYNGSANVLLVPR